jgi:N6-adenosine-specific RNA methylase IME4
MSVALVRRSPSADLTVPDPRVTTVPAGWWQQAAQLVLNAESWNELDEIEARILAMAAFIEAKGGDRLEFEKALRVVEKRRGDLLGPDVRKGERTDLNTRVKVPDDVSDMTVSRYRQLARWWDALIYPRLLEETHVKAVTQAALLRQIAAHLAETRQDEIATRRCDTRFARLYDVLVIDPPWPIEKIARDVRPNQARLDYRTMSVEQIAALALPTRAHCHVWLWTTHRFLPRAFDVLKAWGLKYVCTFVWHKPGGFQPVGLPQLNCEFAVYARRGSPKFASTKGLKTCFAAPRGKHSEKPDAFYSMVRKTTPGTQDRHRRWNRLDMFNRRAIEGFDRWGLEAK